MYTYNCVNAKGNKVSNQFIIFTPKFTSLKSYNYIIVKTTFEDGQRVIYLDSYYWNYSKIIGKYRKLISHIKFKKVVALIHDQLLADKHITQY